MQWSTHQNAWNSFVGISNHLAIVQGFIQILCSFPKVTWHSFTLVYPAAKNPLLFIVLYQIMIWAVSIFPQMVTASLSVAYAITSTLKHTYFLMMGTTSELGNPMPLAKANLLKLPIVVLTQMENLPVILVTPRELSSVYPFLWLLTIQVQVNMMPWPR